MNFEGNTNYLHAKYQNICDRLSLPYGQLYADNTYLGKWLRTKSVAVKINHNMFIHGGISEEMLIDNYNLLDINKYFNIWANSNNLMDYDKNTRDSIELITKDESPLWYRGYFNMNLFDRGQSFTLSEKTIDKILKHFGVGHIIVGHTVVNEIKGLFGNKVIAIDIKLPTDDVLDNQSVCQLLIIEGSKYYQVGLEGKKTLLLSE
jgi:hypothetical protein